MTKVYVLVLLFSCFTDPKIPKVPIITTGVVFETRETCEEIRSHEATKQQQECREYGVIR